MKNIFIMTVMSILLGTFEVSAQKSVALTYDDGPNTTTTPKVLDKLEKYNVVGSFFVIGDNINEESAKVMKRASDMGCDIENHSKSHQHMSKLTEEQLKNEISYTTEKIESAISKKVKFFRPPYIDTNELMFKAIDLTFICGQGAEDCVKEVTSEKKTKKILDTIKDGDVILLHDFDNNDATVDALDEIISTLNERGSTFVTVTDLFKEKGITPQKGVMYTNRSDDKKMYN